MEAKFGITFLPSDPKELEDWVICSEDSGFDILGLADSQSIYRELYVSMTITALKTRKIPFGPRVTNPLTRHPAVTASGMATLEEIAPGRTFLGIGTGDSALAAIGEKGVPLKALREYVLAVRGLIEGRTVTYRDKAMRLPWCKMNIPILIAAHGPKTLRLAGAIADGVVVGTGFTPEVAADTMAQIRQGAQEAGRDFSKLDIWWWTHINIADSRDQALHDLLPGLCAAGNHLTRFTAEGKHIPPNLLQAFKDLRGQYQVEDHFVPGESTVNSRLVEKLGLKDYLADRFAIAGSPEECAERIRSLVRIGVTKFWTPPSFTDKMAFMKRWAREVMPRLG
jgi:5,10-methylenetetrahydromethanopterin reductase